MEYYKNLSLEDLFYIDDDGLVCCEEWKYVKGKDNYMFSNLGRVRSEDMFIKYKDGRNYIKPKKIKTQTLCNKIYLYTMLVINDKSYYQAVHKLVAEAFLGHIPCGYKEIIDHINNDPLDNRVVNLQVTNQRENASKNNRNRGFGNIGIKVNKSSINPFEVSLYINKKQVYIGCFPLNEIASKAYNLSIKNIDKYNGNNKEFRALVKSLL